LFQTKIKGFQQATFNGSFFNITGEDLRSRGFDADVLVPLVGGLRVRGQLTYADTIRTASRLHPPGAPKWSGNVSLNLDDQRLSDSLSFAGDVGIEFRSRIFLTNEENTLGFPGRPNNVVPDSPGYALFNGRLAIKGNDGWEIALIGRNLTNKTVIDYSVPISLVGNGAYVTLNRPRTVSLQLTLRR
jgi:iron complex outermembrane receptor protein